MPPLTRLKMAAASQHSLPSAAADAFAVVASMPDHSIVEKSKASPVQPYWRLQPSKRLTRAASSSLEKRGSVCGFPTLGSGCTDITDFLSVGIRISYRWVPRNRVGAFILRSEDPTAIRGWSPTRVNPLSMLHLSNSNDSYLVGTRTNSSPRHPRLPRPAIPNSGCLREAAGVRRDPTALRRRP